MENNDVFYLTTDESFATKAIHVGSDPDQWKSRAVVPPITLASTFKQEEPGKFEFEYGRTGNPSRQALEECLATLDGGKHGLCFSSGLGAISSVAMLMNAGDHVLCVDNVYGGTVRFFNEVTTTKGITTTFMDAVDVDKFCAGVQPNTKMVYIESVTNPMLKVIDIRKIASKIHSIDKSILVVVDNTFLTPYFLKPLDFGADIVIHSVTKYINGHSDVIMGAVVVNDEAIYKRLKFIQSCCGAVPSPFDCYLVTRGVKTLQLRMDQHMRNSLAVAKFLESHPMVVKVIHPGLPSHPQHKLVEQTWSGYGGMCSFYIRGGLEESKVFLKSLKVFTLATSLGGYESLAGLPALMTHISLTEGERNELGITNNFIRLSIGLESPRDLLNDLDQALRSTKNIKTRTRSMG